MPNVYDKVEKYMNEELGPGGRLLAAGAAATVAHFAGKALAKRNYKKTLEKLRIKLSKEKNSEKRSYYQKRIKDTQERLWDME